MVEILLLHSLNVMDIFGIDICYNSNMRSSIQNQINRIKENIFWSTEHAFDYKEDGDKFLVLEYRDYTALQHSKFSNTIKECDTLEETYQFIARKIAEKSTI